MSRTLLDDCYDHCIRLTKRTAGNFYYSFCGLPAPQFRAMCALYAFMRVTDDWGDDATRAPARRIADLDDWQQALTSALRPDWSIAEMTGWSEAARTVLPAMSDVTVRFAIPHEHLFAVMRGVRSDLEFEISNLKSRQNAFKPSINSQTTVTSWPEQSDCVAFTSGAFMARKRCNARSTAGQRFN